jgi:hypothetical protein
MIGTVIEVPFGLSFDDVEKQRGHRIAIKWHLQSQ